jgi:hypothetical protein
MDLLDAWVGGDLERSEGRSVAGTLLVLVEVLREIKLR